MHFPCSVLPKAENRVFFHALARLYRRIERESERNWISFFDEEARETERMCGADLGRRADAISASLVHRYGIEPGDRVLLVYPPSLEFVYALAGCMFAGAIAVPASPPRAGCFDSDCRSLGRIARDCQPRLVLSSREYRGPRDLPGAEFWLDSEAFQVASQPRVRHSPQLEDVAFLQYTSGTTAAPKGVRVTWACLAHQRELYKRDLHMTPESRSVCWVPQYHDMGLIGGILNGLFLGCWLGLLSPLSFLKRPASWFEVMDRVQATHGCGPDFGYALALARTTPEQRSRWDLSQMKALINGAEPVRAEITEAFCRAFAASRFPREAWCPAYGLAEHTLAATLNGGRVRRFCREQLAGGRAEPVEEGGQPLVSCGTTGVDVVLEIVDPVSRKPLEPGQVGEIWVDSPSKADGYWQREGLSRERFQAQLDGASGGFLRTGDLGFCYEGELFVCGRLKDLLIVGGRNIYASDVEVTAQACDARSRAGGVAAFSLAQDTSQPDALGLLVELREGQLAAAPARELLETIERQVARIHGLACAWLALVPPKSLLKTTSGKLRRQASRDAALAGAMPILLEKRSPGCPQLTAQTQEQPSDARRWSDAWRWSNGRITGALAECVEEILSQVMGLPLEEVRSTGNLRALGLHSLLAVEACQRLEARLGIALDATLFLRHNHLEDALAEVEAWLQRPAPQRAPKARPAEAVPSGSRVVEAAPGHVDLWKMSGYVQLSAMHNVCAAFRAPVVLDPELLERALGLLSARHDALRCRLFERDGKVWLKAVAGVDHQVISRDLSGLGPQQRGQQLSDWLHRRPLEPFDLSQTPLLRVAVLKLSERDSVLWVCASCAICDGGALELLLRELSQAYEALAQGRLPEWQPAPSYVEYCEDLRSWLQSEDARQARSWWASYLDGVQSHPLPTDFEAPPQRSDRGGLVRLQMPASFSHQLDEAAQAVGCTPFVLLLGAWALLMHEAGGQGDFAVSVAVGRRLQATQRWLLGLLEEDLPLRCSLSHQQSLEQALAHIRRSLLGVLQHQSLPTLEIEEAVGEPPGGSFSSFVRSLFVMHPLEWSQPAFAGHRLEQLSGPVLEGAAEYDLSFYVRATPEGYELSLSYASDLFRKDGARELLGRYRRILEGIAGGRWLEARLEDLYRQVSREQRCQSPAPMQVGTQEFDAFWFRLDFHDCDPCLEFGSRQAVIGRLFAAAGDQLSGAKTHSPVAGVLRVQGEEGSIECDYRREVVALSCQTWGDPSPSSRFLERIANILNPSAVGVVQRPHGAVEMHPFYRVGLMLYAPLYREHSPHQEIELGSHPAYGRVLLLNKELQIASYDEAIYSRAMAELSREPQVSEVCILGGGDCGVLREVLCADVQKVTMIELDARVIELCQEYFPDTVGESLSDPRTELQIGDAFAFMESSDRRFDLVIYDLADAPIGGVGYPQLVRLLQKILAPEGQLVLQCGEATAAWNRSHREGLLTALEEGFGQVERRPILIPSFGEEPWLIVHASHSRS